MVVYNILLLCWFTFSVRVPLCWKTLIFRQYLYACIVLSGSTMILMNAQLKISLYLYIFIAEGMVVRTNDFQVLASTCKDHRNSRVTANVGIKLHCTAILDQQRFDNDYPSRSDRQPRYCAGWWDSTSRRTCNTPYSAFESRRVSADKDGIHCSVAQLYGFPYYVYYYYYDHRLLYDIPINIIRKGKNNTAHTICSCVCCIDVVEAHTLLR